MHTQFNHIIDSRESGESGSRPCAHQRVEIVIVSGVPGVDLVPQTCTPYSRRDHVPPAPEALTDSIDSVASSRESGSRRPRPLPMHCMRFSGVPGVDPLPCTPYSRRDHVPPAPESMSRESRGTYRFNSTCVCQLPGVGESGSRCPRPLPMQLHEILGSPGSRPSALYPLLQTRSRTPRSRVDVSRIQRHLQIQFNMCLPAPGSRGVGESMSPAAPDAIA